MCLFRLRQEQTYETFVYVFEGWGCGFNLQVHLISGTIIDSSRRMPFSQLAV